MTPLPLLDPTPTPSFIRMRTYVFHIPFLTSNLLSQEAMDELMAMGDEDGESDEDEDEEEGERDEDEEEGGEMTCKGFIELVPAYSILMGRILIQGAEWTIGSAGTGILWTRWNVHF